MTQFEDSKKYERSEKSVFLKKIACYTQMISLSGLILLSTSAIAGGSIFGGKSKTSNPKGVNSIGVHICTTLNCPNMVIKQGDCDGVDHAYMTYGVCVCESGYTARDGQCVADGGVVVECGEGTYLAHEGDTSCTPCPQQTCPADNECCTLTGPEDVCGNPTPVYGFKGANGTCKDCSWNLAPDLRGSLTAEECAKCDASPTPRKLIHILSQKFCARSQCDSGYFQDLYGTCKACSSEVRYASTGSCYNCSDEQAESLSAGACSACDNTDTPRVTYNLYWYNGSWWTYHMCVLPCEEGELHNDDKESTQCVSCSYSGILYVDANECARCDNTLYPRRMADEHSCVLDLEAACRADCAEPNQCLPNGEE